MAGPGGRGEPQVMSLLVFVADFGFEQNFSFCGD